jgi:hypothetical protein
VADSVAAAVLVPLLEVDGETHVLFIKRPETMSTHQGEIAFPGGKLDPAVDADVRAAALREARRRSASIPRRSRSWPGSAAWPRPPSALHDLPVRGLSRPPARARANPGEVVRVLQVRCRS